MSNQLPDRLRWAIELLNVQPDDRILEIGCGHGLTITPICERLTTGKLTALDRSDKMIAMASRRNQAMLTRGKVEFINSEIDQAIFERGAFGKIFGVHVNVFWMQPARELAVIREALAPGGGLLLVYQPLHPGKTAALIEQLRGNLQAHGFPTVELFETDSPSGRIIAVHTTRP